MKMMKMRKSVVAAMMLLGLVVAPVAASVSLADDPPATTEQAGAEAPKKEGGESQDAKKKANSGFMGVVFLYKDPEFAAKLQPEALYKAAHCFDKLSQSGRADFMRTELKRSYASSPWANK